jgi:hypothetical protein
MCSSSNGDVVPFLLFDQTKTPQKVFDDHDRYLHQKVRTYNSANFFQRIDQPKGNECRRIRGKFVRFMCSSLGPSSILRVLEARVLFRSTKRTVKSGYYFVYFQVSREKSITYIV